jgi:ATP-grasp ribosomal peptide maturase
LSGEGHVLALTHQFDPTADYVVEELNRREVPVFRCNPGDFPRALSLTATLGDGWTGSLRLENREIRLEDIRCAYYRRPTVFEFPAGMSEPERKWAINEARMGFGGIISAIPHWLNHPAAISRAEYKPVQLDSAAAVGLRVPKTIVTNDPSAAKMFAESVPRMIYKPLSSTPIAEDHSVSIIYTTPVDPSSLGPSVAYTTHLFQEWVPKQYEVRLTVIDDQLFAARIDATSSAAAIDWRSDYENVSYSIAEVPCPISRGVLDLMSTLRLRFGVAVQLVVEPRVVGRG